MITLYPIRFVFSSMLRFITKDEKNRFPKRFFLCYLHCMVISINYDFSLFVVFSYFGFWKINLFVVIYKSSLKSQMFNNEQFTILKITKNNSSRMVNLMKSTTFVETRFDMDKKKMYVIVLSLLFLFLLAGYIPDLSPYTSWLTPPIVLFIGLMFAIFVGQPYPKFNKKMSKYLLQYAVVGLGFGMNLSDAIARGKEGMLFTIVSVFGTMLVGWFIGRKVLKVDRNSSYLISTGTAICGGSAIATVGPIINAKDEEMSVSLATIFILNAIALLIFPVVGEWLGLSQTDFGMWAAIAIHDTSSVVGAGAAYGEEALQVATTVKLTRALWIVLVALFTMFLFRSKNKKLSLPLFILFFIVALIINSYFLSKYEWGVNLGNMINDLSKKVLTLTMFFIGASLTKNTLNSIGAKSLLLGVVLWIFISVITLGYIYWT